MRKGLGCVGLALLVAGTVTIALPTAAQQGPAPPLSPGEHPPTVANSSSQATSERGRLLEIKVELALMADRATFPYRIGAHARGQRIELRGYVPTEVVRQRALTIAAEHSAGPVRDYLRIYPQAATHCGAATASELESATRKLLQEAFPEQGRFLVVQAGANGLVTVAGTMSSYEEKVAVSHCLRQVRGCLAVDNHLRVPRVVFKGKPYTILNADSQQMLPADGDEESPAAAAGHARDMAQTNAPPVSLGTHLEPLRSSFTSEEARPASNPLLGMIEPAGDPKGLPSAVSCAKILPAFADPPEVEKPAFPISLLPQAPRPNEAIRNNYVNSFRTPLPRFRSYYPTNMVSPYHPKWVMPPECPAGTILEAPVPWSKAPSPYQQMFLTKIHEHSVPHVPPAPARNSIQLASLAQAAPSTVKSENADPCPRAVSKASAAAPPRPFPSEFFQTSSVVATKPLPKKQPALPSSKLVALVTRRWPEPPATQWSAASPRNRTSVVTAKLSSEKPADNSAVDTAQAKQSNATMAFALVTPKWTAVAPAKSANTVTRPSLPAAAKLVTTTVMRPPSRVATKPASAVVTKSFSKVGPERTAALVSKPSSTVSVKPKAANPSQAMAVVYAKWSPPAVTKTLAVELAKPAPAIPVKPPETIAATPAAKPGTTDSSQRDLVSSATAKVDLPSPSPAKPDPAGLQRQMKKSITTACGQTAQDVDVIFKSCTCMLVRLKVTRPEDGVNCSQKIFQLPALYPYQVNLEVKVVP